MKKNELIIPIILNLLVIFILYFDFLLPAKNFTIEEFSFFEDKVFVETTKRGGKFKTVKYNLLCKSGNEYLLYEVPDNLDILKEGDKIIVGKTFIFQKVKYVTITNKNLTFNISILSFPVFYSLFFLSAIISLINLYFDNNFVLFLLCFACGFTIYASIGYLFCLS